MKVVLPAPFGPISAWRAPASSRKLMSRDGGERAEALAERAGFEQMSRHDGPRLVMKRLVSWSHSPMHAVAREQRDQHQQQAEAELPGGRIDLRQEMRERHVDDGADERAVEAAVAAEHQDDQHGGGAVEAERREVHIGVGLRPQSAGDAGDRGRDGVAGDQPPVHRRADRVHAQHVLADAGEALPERRIDQRADEHEADEQHAEHVEILHARIERIELEQAEQRRDRQVRQTVEAAGVFLAHVGGFLEQRHGAEREHQQRQAGRAQKDQPGREARSVRRRRRQGRGPRSARSRCRDAPASRPCRRRRRRTRHGRASRCRHSRARDRARARTGSSPADRCRSRDSSGTRNRRRSRGSRAGAPTRARDGG